MKITAGEVKTAELHGFLLGSIGPRPICFASTVDREGRPNLAPFSFFNVFGANPPICVFSPARRVRNNTGKHTLANVQEVPEVVINVVSYSMVQQMSLASCEYPKAVNEFEKSGFTPVASDLIRPFRVQESPVSIECKVNQIIETGSEGGAGNLIIAQVLCLHINPDILGADGRIDPHKIDLVARMGGDYYCRASGEAVFSVPKPNTQLGIGVDQLPESIRRSRVLTGNDLGMLANVSQMPAHSALRNDERLRQIIREFSSDHKAREHALHVYAQELLARQQVEEAWQVLLTDT